MITNRHTGLPALVRMLCVDRGVRGSDLLLVSEQEVSAGQADELRVADRLVRGCYLIGKAVAVN